jgi:L-aminopeptidase/D-esterase-like protein
MGEQDWIVRDRSTPVPPIPGGAGSVIAVVATDAPMTPHQTSALARRVPLGLARTGTTGGHFSGDIFLGFSTANPGELDSGFSLIDKEQVTLRSLEFVPWNWMDEFYAAVVQCVEESVLNALVNNETMYGRAGSMSPALPLELVMARLNRP